MNANILSKLCEAHIDFVLVGAAAAIVNGVPVTTFDVDIVPHRTAENLDRLFGLLTDIDAHYRGRPANQKLRPTREHLDTPGHILLRTTLGPLDVLGSIEAGADYAWLIARSRPIPVFGHKIHVPTLDTLIELKRHGTRPEDPLKLRLMEETQRVMKLQTAGR